MFYDSLSSDIVSNVCVGKNLGVLVLKLSAYISITTTTTTTNNNNNNNFYSASNKYIFIPDKNIKNIESGGKCYTKIQ